MTAAEVAWWCSLEGDAITANTEGVPPYDVDRVAREIEATLFPNTYGRVLDLGCGTGRLTAAVAELLPEATLIGADVSATMLDATQERGFDVWRLGAVPMLPAPLVGAYSVTVFQHLPADECAAYVRAVGEALTVGGRFVFQFVVGDEDAFCSHQVSTETARLWVHDAGLRLAGLWLDPVFESWRWIAADKYRPTS